MFLYIQLSDPGTYQLSHKVFRCTLLYRAVGTVHDALYHHSLPLSAENYHWRQLPQVSFLSQQKFCHDKHEFAATKHVFCRDKSTLVITKLLSKQTRVCHDKSFVEKAYFCRDKHMFVTTKHVFCCDKSMPVATKLLS